MGENYDWYDDRRQPNKWEVGNGGIRLFEGDLLQLRSESQERYGDDIDK